MADTTVRMRVDSPLLPPRYCDAERIGDGGTSEVYRATDAELGRTVAVKLLREHVTDPERRRRFRREALAAARLSHEPHTVTIYDVGEFRGRAFIVMEHLAGGSLEERLRRDGAVPQSWALLRLGEAAEALDHAHAQGVVHRDVKPANILLDREDHARVADFGIATAVGLASLTQTGTVLGTAGYLAPEQAEGRHVTAAADRYALGVLAFELLTGDRPFRQDSFTAEASAHVNAPVPSASARRHSLPPAVDAVFERALAKDPAARFASCRELAGALAAACAPADDATVILTAPARQRRARRFVPWLAAAAALVVGLGVGALAGRHGRAAAPPPLTVTHVQTATTTVSRTVTVRTSAPNGGIALDRQADGLISASNFQGALPLLQQAVQQLNGSGTPAEANADYDLAYTLVRLGSCDGVAPLLDRAQAVAGAQPRFDQLRAACTGPQAPGFGFGHGHGKG